MDTARGAPEDAQRAFDAALTAFERVECTIKLARALCGRAQFHRGCGGQPAASAKIGRARAPFVDAQAFRDLTRLDRREAAFATSARLEVARRAFPQAPTAPRPTTAFAPG